MDLPNPPLSGGTRFEYRRRPQHACASNAIAAAEAAAQLILSDNPPPIRNKNSVRRSIAGRSQANNGSSGSNDSGGAAERGKPFLLRIHHQREGAMQRQNNREKAPPLKIRAWIALFCVGVLFLSVGVHQEHQEQRRLRHHSERASAKGSVGDAGFHREVQQIGVPLPPNKVRGMERRYQNEKKQKQQNEADSAPKPKMISIENYASTTEPNHHRHAIPPTLIFTYHTDLLATKELDLNDEEDVALSKNVKRILSFHPQSSVRFLTDKDCIQSIRAALGPDTNLTTYFANEERGMIKADMCRGAALYETGGLYFDVDIESRMSVFEAIAPDTAFVTTLVHKDSKHPGGFFQAFIGATPRHKVLKRYLELFVSHYEGKLEVGGPLGVYFLRKAYDECGDENTTDLWQEIRYSPASFPDIQRDHWGKRRACQMLVVAPSKNSAIFKRKKVVPFFSRANGSRMCGGKDTNKKG